MSNLKAGLIQICVTVLVLSMVVCFPGQVLAVGWTIQVKSCITQPEADGVVKNLEAYGLKPEVAYERAGNKGMRYRVLVGRFEGRNAAEIYAQELKTSGIVKDYWIKPAADAPVYEAASQQPAPMSGSEYLGGGSIDDHPVVYPHTSNQVAMNQQVYHSNPGAYGPAISDPVVESPYPPQVMPQQPPLQACQPGVPGSCTGTAHPAGNQVILDDQPPMKACDSYSANQFYLNNCPPVKRGMYVGARAGVMFWPNASDFKIVRTRNAVATVWQEDYSSVPYFSFFTGYRFNNYFALEGALDLPYTYEWKSWFLSLTPKFMYPLAGTNMTPFVKGGPVFGSFKWTDVPNDFDNAWGWEVGGGVDIEVQDRMTVEIGGGYRNIVFDYNEPINTTTPNGDLDLSGYTLDVGLRYRF